MQQRNSHWFSSGAFATIALVAMLKEIDDISDQNKARKWTVSGISVALGMAGLAIFANLILRDKFVGTHLEGGMAAMTFGMWAAVLPAMMDPANEIATAGPFGGIKTPNLFFFSWGAALTSLLVLVGIMKEKLVKEEIKNSQFMQWAMLSCTSFVVMAAASRQFKDNGCDDMDTMQCNRTEFALGLGVASGVVCLLWMGALFFVSMPVMVDALMACLMLAAWVVGIVLVTFGGIHKAAAPTLSNLYFFTWGSFGLSSRLVATDVFTVFSSFMTGETVEGDEEEKKADEEAGGDEEEPVEKEEPAAPKKEQGVEE